MNAIRTTHTTPPDFPTVTREQAIAALEEAKEAVLVLRIGP